MKGIRETAKSLYNRILAGSEGESSSNGYLSYRAEWHAAAWGVAVGFLYALTGDAMWITLGVGWLFTRGGDKEIPEYVPYPKQFMKESLYIIAHIPAGAAIGITIKMLIQIV